jgi:hypothetical protein
MFSPDDKTELIIKNICFANKTRPYFCVDDITIQYNTIQYNILQYINDYRKELNVCFYYCFIEYIPWN